MESRSGESEEDRAVNIADACIQKIRGGMDIDHILRCLFQHGYSAGRAEAVEKPNKVIQIALAAYQGMGLVALCEDGSLWFTERPYDIKMTWAQLPPPQEQK